MYTCSNEINDTITCTCMYVNLTYIPKCILTVRELHNRVNNTTNMKHTAKLSAVFCSMPLCFDNDVSFNKRGSSHSTSLRNAHA